MVKHLFKYYIYPIATLAGSIIGVGFLSLPYITLQVGMWPMLLYVVVLTALVVFLHVIFGQVSLRAPDYKMFAGITGFYLGPFAKILTLFLMVVGLFGVLLAYLLVGGEFLFSMLSPFLGGSLLSYTLGYFTVVTVIIYVGIRAISKLEFWSLVLLFIALAIICANRFSPVTLGSVFSYAGNFTFDWKLVFLPFGPIVFSLWGVGMIPETEEMMVGRKGALKKVIIISTLIPAALYLLFIFLILGISGAHTTESALIGLKEYLGQGLFLVALFVGLITTFAASIAQGLLLKKTFVYDIGFGQFSAWAFTCFVPLILFLMGVNSFIPLISFIGGVFLSIDGIFILLMYQKIGGKKVIIYPLLLVFVLVILYEGIYFVK